MDRGGQQQYYSEPLRGRGRGGNAGGSRGGYQGQQMYSRGGGGVRGSSAPRGNGTPRGRGGPNRREPLKFDGDYDFEEANAQFHKDDIEKEFKKLNVSSEGGGSPPPPKAAAVVNGAEGSADEEEDPEDEDNTQYYDKQKSFFDSISCDATDRAKGGNQRPNWREERKLNAETFGVSAYSRNHYYGYRGGRGRGGRGGYNSRGGGMRGGRGGYQNRGGNGYRGGFRNRNNQAWVDYDYDVKAGNRHHNSATNGEKAAATNSS